MKSLEEDVWSGFAPVSEARYQSAERKDATVVGMTPMDSLYDLNTRWGEEREASENKEKLLDIHLDMAGLDLVGAC